MHINKWKLKVDDIKNVLAFLATTILTILS